MRTRSHASSAALRGVGWVGMAGGIGLAYSATSAAGGTNTGLGQLFYLPILAAAFVYGPAAGVAAGAASGAVCALVPLDTATGAEQDTRSWALRAAVFVLAGLVTGVLSSRVRSQREQLGRLRRETVAAFEHAIDAMHHYTAEHSASVAECAVAIARRLGVDAETVDRVRGAALLHDVGKFAVPVSLLDKAGPLSPEEWETVHGHVEAALAIVGCIAEFGPFMAGIRHHHERYDGTGYPDGLRGDTIPLEARIIAVADAYDAMISPRAYRLQLSHVQAVSALRHNAGSQFDPAVVAAFVSLPAPFRLVAAQAAAEASTAASTAVR